MARPLKNNADYFPHDNDMRNDEKIKAVRRKYSHLGYAIWNMILEKLCKSDNFELSLTEMNLELLAGDFEIEPKQLKEILDYSISIDLLQQKGVIIYSSELKTRFEGLFRKRKRDRERVLADENTQRKLKETKEKKSTEKKDIPSGKKPDKHPKDKKSIKKQEKDYGSQELLSYFGKKYKEQFSITYFASFKKEITLFNNLLKLYNPPHILDLIDIFFIDVKKGKEEEEREEKDSKESKWVANKASVGVFFSQVNKLNISLAKIRDDSRRKDA